ncbi:post-transcriptional regulator [Pseudogracilibacillus sp. SE30717A]|uniref:post-transcriptional regulator n=1 Tax=Pseudogracilibacillus sp. SE30717A TaxID=3098293 RepID=UPI00300DE5D9
MEVKTVMEWKSHVAPALESKQSEFKLIGYPEATLEEIWKCLEEKVWKGNPQKKIHEVVQDIFHLPATTYMSFMTIKALQVEDDDLMASIEALTKPHD